jgi:hypothetical protein
MDTRLKRRRYYELRGLNDSYDFNLSQHVQTALELTL